MEMQRGIPMRVQLILLELIPILLLLTFAFYVTLVLRRICRNNFDSAAFTLFFCPISINLFFFLSQFLPLNVSWNSRRIF